MSPWKNVAVAAFAAALLSSAPVAPAQVSVDIGVAPVCPYGYFDYAPYQCAPYGYYGPDWFAGASSLALVRGFTVIAVFTATLTIAMTLTMATGAGT